MAKHPGGRPTVATEENIAKAWAYINQDWDTIKEVPTVERAALILDIHKDTLYEREEFSDVLRKIKSLQGEKLIQKGLSGEYNPTIAKLLLSSKHGYVEKSDVTSAGKALPQPILGGISVSSDDSNKEDS